MKHILGDKNTRRKGQLCNIMNKIIGVARGWMRSPWPKSWGGWIQPLGSTFHKVGGYYHN